MLVMFAVECVVSRIVGCFFYIYFLNFHLDGIVLPWYKVTVNV